MTLINRTFGLLSIVSFISLGGCQTTPIASSGNLAPNDGRAPPTVISNSVINVVRDDQASDAIERVFIQPAVLAEGVGADITEAERWAVLREVDRQICFEVSKRFTVIPIEDTDAALIKTLVVRISPTGKVGGGASAAVAPFIPVPFLKFRGGKLGGLAIESEMLAPNSGKQVAAVTWGLNATTVGTVSPSLSPIGDALQLAEPMGDAVGKAFASKSRKKRKIANPDPCQHYGPRVKLTGNQVLGAVSGLYVPDAEPAKEPK